MAPKKLPISERIDKHIVSKENCWLTDLACLVGYPLININGKMKRLSRVIYELHFGEIPPGKLVCHQCDNPSCVNPDHLFLGSYFENMKDRDSKNRQAKGSKCRLAKLDEAKVLEIKRDLAETNLSSAEIAKKFCVSRDNIYLIKNGKTWKHVTYQPTNVTNNITNNYNAPVTNNITYNCSECPKQLTL
ncbi:MAG: hypothetical protein RLZZ338_1419 [Cyanobacteriota bacterium]|jgi:hypothetical protein